MLLKMNVYDSFRLSYDDRNSHTVVVRFILLTILKILCIFLHAFEKTLR